MYSIMNIKTIKYGESYAIIFFILESISNFAQLTFTASCKCRWQRYFCRGCVRNVADCKTALKYPQRRKKTYSHKLTDMSKRSLARKVALFRVTSASWHEYLQPRGYFIKGIPDLVPWPIRIHSEKSATYTEKVPMPLWETGPACAFNVASRYRCTRKRSTSGSDAALVDHIWPTYALMMIKS